MGGRISESSIREIRDRADIVEIVSESVSLSRSGAAFRGLCPFHREKSPSFYVHPSKQVFHCFGCGEGGSVFHFLMKSRNLPFSDAVEELGERYGIPVVHEGGGPAARPREDLYAILRIAADAYRGFLRSPSGRGARELLRRRGVTEEAEQEFLLGYGGGGRELLDALARQGVDPAKAAQAGLLYANEGGGYRERFRARVIFPIADARGRICGFGARAVGDAQPKYLNSPESELYHKGSVLYGLHQALPALRQSRAVVVVEGYMDLIALWQRGIRNVVATCGTSLTESHARTLKRLVDDVILFFDGDAAGKRSAVRAGDPLHAAGVSPRVLFPPKGLDPDDWAKGTDGRELSTRIEEAVPLMDYIERAASRKFDLGQIRGKLSYLSALAPYLRRIGDVAERRLYVRRVAQATELPEETVLERIRDRDPAGRGGGSRPEVPAAVAPARKKPAAPEEQKLLAMLVADPALAASAVRDGLPELLSDDGVRAVVLAMAAGGGAGGAAAVLEAESEAPVRGRIAEEMLLAAISPEKAREEYPVTALMLRIRRIERDIAGYADRKKEALGAGDLRTAQEMLERQKAAAGEKERLEAERNALMR